MEYKRSPAKTWERDSALGSKRRIIGRQKSRTTAWPDSEQKLAEVRDKRPVRFEGVEKIGGKSLGQFAGHVSFCGEESGSLAVSP